METSKSKTASKHRPLTPLRVIRGVICLAVFVTTAFTFLVYLAPPLAVALRCFSLSHCRRATSFVFGLWLALWPFLFEKINGTKVVFSGDRVPSKERVLLVSNHRTEVDWMYLWNLALRKGCLGNIKYVLKKSLMKLPLLGWGFHVLEFVPLERNWELDEPVLRRMVSSFSHDSRDPLWLVIFPEGTDFTEQKSERSREFATKFGLPVLTNVLLPKTKGFCACLEELRNSLDAVYDITIAYKNNCPTFLDNVFGVDPSQVHINIRRIVINDIPTSETNSGAWLIDAFEHKDKLLSDFKAQGCFPNAVSEKELSFLKCLANSMMIIIITIIFIYFTFYSFVCFKIYVILSCVYFAFATHMNIQPMPFYNYVRRYCD